MTEPLEETIELLKTGLVVSPNHAGKRFLLGRAYLQIGRREEALKELDRSLAIDPNRVDGYVLKGTAHAQLDQWSEAATAFTKAVQLGPERIDVWQRLAQARHKLEEHAPALAAAERVLAAEANSEPALLYAGDSLTGLGRDVEAAHMYERLAKIRPDDPDVLGALGAAWFRAQRWEETVTAYSRRGKVPPPSAIAHRDLGRALAALHRPEEAVVQLRLAADLDEKDIITLSTLAEEEEKIGDLDRALPSRRAAVHHHPSSPELQVPLGELLLRMHNPQEALRAFDDARSHRQDDGRAWKGRGISLAALGRHIEAADALEHAIKLDPKDTRAYADLAAAYRELQRMGDASSTLERALVVAPDDPELHLELGRHHVAEGKLEDAVAAYEAAVQRAPRHPIALRELADARRGVARHDAAVEAYKLAIALDPGTPSIHEGLGRSLAALGRHVEALSSFETATRLDPSVAAYPREVARELAFLARHDEAVSTCERAIERFPDDAELLIELGAALDRAGRLEKAVTVLGRARATLPGDVRLLRSLASVLRRLGRADDALKAVDDALRQAPSDGALHAVRGALLADLGKERESIEALEQATWLTPTDARIHAELGIVLRKLGRLEGAIRSLEESLRLAPKDADVRYQLACAYDESGREADARAEYRRVTEDAPGNADAAYKLGKLLAHAGQVEDAVARFRDATRARPDFAEAYEAAGAGYRKLGQLQDALQALRHAARLAPDRIDVARELGLTYVAMERWEDADDPLSRFVAAQPTDAATRLELAKARARRGKDAEAIVDLRLLTADPVLGTEAHRVLADVYEHAGNLKESLASREVLVKRVPDDALLHRALGLCAEKAGDDVLAVRAYTDALRVQPGLAGVGRRLGELQLRLGDHAAAITTLESLPRAEQDDPKLLLRLSRAYHARGIRDRAWVALRRAGELGASNDIDALMLAGELYAEEGDHTRSLDCFERSLRQDGSRLDAVLGAGVAALALQRAEAARDHFQAALRLKPEDPSASLGLADALLWLGEAAAALALYDKLGAGDELAVRRAECLVALGQHDEATAILPSLIERFPALVRPRYLLGMSRLRLGQIGAATELLEEATRLDPSDGRALAGLGLAYALSQKHAQAVSSLEAAMGRTQLDGEAYFALGNSLHHLQRFDDAIRAYEWARSLGASTFALERQLGDAYGTRDDYESAAAAYARAVEASPHDPDVRYHLALCYHRLGRTELSMQQYGVLRTLRPATAELLFRSLAPS